MKIPEKSRKIFKHQWIPRVPRWRPMWRPMWKPMWRPMLGKQKESPRRAIGRRKPASMDSLNGQTSNQIRTHHTTLVNIM